MSSDGLYFISAVGAMLWVFGAVVGGFYFNDVRMVLWPITLVLLVPLGVWLVIKFVFQYLAGIGSIYKEKA